MAVALVSTKRKFHQVLDSLTNVPGTSIDPSGGAKRVATSSLPTWNEPPTKKARLARRNSTLVAPSSRTNAQPPTTSQLPHTAFLAKTADNMAELPNFAPTNRRQFIERLETFKDVTKWSEKPERINEVQWAKRGWTCVDKERVGCVKGCEKQVVIKLARTRVEETGVEKTGVDKTGVEETGAEKTGVEETGVEKTGVEETGAEKTGVDKTGVEKTGVEKTGVEKTGTEKTGVEKTGVEETGAEKTGVDKTGVEKTGVEETGTEKTGVEETGAEKAGTEKTGVDKTGVEKTGVEETGAEKTGVDKTGVEKTGDAGNEQVQEMQQQQQEWDDEIDEHLVDEYVKIIETGHHENCLWRRRGCNELIYRLPLVFAQSSLAAFRSRYDSLDALATIRRLTIVIPRSFEGPRAVLPPPRDFNTPPLHEINPHALVLALFGWQADSNATYPQATCISCFRRLGLWLYEPKEVRTTDEHGNVASTYNPPVLSTLNVVEEHRTYCPWVNAVSQCGQSPRHGAQAGWQVLVRVAKAAQLSQRERVTSQPALPPATSGDVASPAADASVEEVVAVGGGAAVEAAGGDGGSKPGSKEARDAKDKERVTKLRKLARMFRGRKGKKKEGGAGGAGAVASG